jgi:hypothetical protein
MTHERMKLTDELTVLLLNIDLLFLGAYGPLTEEQRQAGRTASSAANGMRDIVRTTDSGFTCD